MPQTGPDLVGAGYPISRPLLALLGGSGNLSQSNVPIATNLDFGLGGLADVALNPASVYVVPVPVSPGMVVSRIGILIGATAGGSITQGWGALYSGTGSTPGTAATAPVLIGQTIAGSVVSNQAAGSAITAPAVSTRWEFIFSSPQTITSSQAPFGYVYAAVCASPADSTVCMTCACVCYYPYYSTSPVFLAGTMGSAFAAPATMGTITKVASPPVVLLS